MILNPSDDPMDREPRDHCIIGRIVTRRGPTGLPESHREIDVCQERHAQWFADNGGWEVLIRDSDVPKAEQPEPDGA
jgi:hypothetical protein